MAYTGEKTRVDDESDSRPGRARLPGHPSRGLYKVLPVRIPVDKWELMTREAGELGIGTCTLARIYILDSLRRVSNANSGNGKNPDR